MLDPAERLVELRVLVPREVEEGEQVAVAKIEKEVGAPGIVAVLEQFDERESEQPLVEVDSPADVGADEGCVVHAAGGALGPLTLRQ